MKLSTREYYRLFKNILNLSCVETVSEKCRNGILNASKDETGNWMIDVPITQEVYDALVEATDKRELSDYYYHEHKKLERDIHKLMLVVLPFLDTIRSSQ